MSRAAKQLTALIAIFALAIALTGCSVSFSTGGDTLSASDVADEAHKKLEPELKAKGADQLPPVTCPHDLDGKKGETMTCEAKGTFQPGVTGTLGIRVTVTGTSGDGASLHFETDPRGVQPLNG